VSVAPEKGWTARELKTLKESYEATSSKTQRGTIIGDVQPPVLTHSFPIHLCCSSSLHGTGSCGVDLIDKPETPCVKHINIQQLYTADFCFPNHPATH